MNRNYLAKLVSDDSGQSLVETSLIYFLIVIAVVASLATFGFLLQSSYLNSAKAIDGVIK